MWPLPHILGLLATAGAAGVYFYMVGRYIRLRALKLETHDVRPQFNYAKAAIIHDSLVSATGEGATLYRHLLLVDFFFPPLFAVALAYWIGIGNLPSWLAVLAVVGALADIVEDTLLVLMLRYRAGTLPRGVAAGLAVATTVKLVFCLLALVGVLACLIYAGIK